MHVLEPSALILLVFSAASLVAALAAAIVTADKLAGAWHHDGEPTRRGRKPRGSRCANAGRRPKRSRDCPVIGSRKHR